MLKLEPLLVRLHLESLVTFIAGAKMGGSISIGGAAGDHALELLRLEPPLNSMPMKLHMWSLVNSIHEPQLMNVLRMVFLDLLVGP